MKAIKLFAVSLVVALQPAPAFGVPLELKEDKHHDLVDASGKAVKTAPIEAHAGLFKFPALSMAKLSKLTGNA